MFVHQDSLSVSCYFALHLQVAPEEPGEFDGFIVSDNEGAESQPLSISISDSGSEEDEPAVGEWPPAYTDPSVAFGVPGVCQTSIDRDAKGNTIEICGELCHQAEQICFYCKRHPFVRY